MASALSVIQPTQGCSEHELVALVRRGSDRAFEELYARYRPRISAYIFGMIGDHARAEDIAQEVFISALRRLQQTERPIAFKPWMYEIAKNACIDEFRRTRRTREVPLHTPEDSVDPDPVLISGAPSPDAAVAGKQSLQDLRGAFHGLSENHHKVIVMRELEGLSYSQIGEKLGMTRPVVESTLFRARRKLGEEYDELASGRRCEQVQALIETDEKESLMKLGIRQRRQLARHLSHCQPCRREARMAELDESLFQAPGIAGKIAALLPFPWLWRRRSHSDRSASVTASSHSIGSLPSFQTLAQVAGLVAPSTGFGRAAAATAGLAVAGIGGGVVVANSSHPPQRASTAASQGATLSPSSSATGRRGTAAATNTATPKRTGAQLRGATGSGAAVVRGGPVRAPGSKRGSQILSSTPTGGAGGTSSGGSRNSSLAPGSSPSTGSGTRHVTVGGITVSTSAPSPSGTVKTPSISAGKLKVPSVSVSAPKLPKAPSLGKSPAPQAGKSATTGAVGGVLHGAGATVQGVTGALPKVSASDPGSALPH